jgi:shikimate kinase
VRNIYLIGYRCSGKSTLGRALADHLGRDFIDMDDELVSREQRSIAHIVQQKGWDYFRRREKALLAQICGLTGRVVGTGGGVVLDPENIARMRASGRVVWLRCRPGTIRRLIEADPRTADSRPALTAKGLLEEISETLKAREPLYRAAMHVSVDTDDFAIEPLCRQIVGKLQNV